MNPADVRNRDFAKKFRGLDPDEVQEHLQQVADRLAELEAWGSQLSVELLQSKDEVAEHRERRKSLEDTLAQTRAMAEEIKTNAEKEAQFIVAEAELQAEKILGQAHNRLAQIHDDITELKRQRAQFEVRLRSLVEAHLKILDVEDDRDRELAELEDKIKILRAPNS